MIKHRFSKTAALVVLVALFTLCNIRQCAFADTQVKKSTSSEATRVITDMLGRKVTIPKNVKSIATFDSVGVLNGFVMLMGDGNKLVNNLPTSFTKTDRWKYQYVFVPKLSERPIFESPDKSILIETVLENRPDVCLSMSKSNVEILQSKGLNVVYLAWKDVDDVKKCINLLGEILNKNNVAAKYSKYFDDTLKKAEKIVKDIPANKRKSFLYAGTLNFNQSLVIVEWWGKKAGGISVTDNGRTTDTPYTYTMEDIFKWNPDVIIVRDKTSIPEIQKDSRFSQLRAVKENKLYVTPSVAHIWAHRTIEQPLMVLWAIHVLYPDRYSYDDLAKEIRYFYREFFRFGLSEDQLKEIIGG